MLPEAVAGTVVLAAGIYLAAGLVFAVAFVALGVGRIDPAARRGSRGFKLLVLPGVAALWPLLAWRWIAGATPPEEATAHRRGARRAQRRGAAP